MKTKRIPLMCLMGAVMISPAVISRADDRPPGIITVITLIDLVPDYAIARNVEDSIALFDKLVADTQHVSGMLSFKVLRDPTRPNHFVILSEWTNMHAFDAYSGAEVTKHFRQAVQSRLGGPFDERIFNDVK